MTSTTPAGDQDAAPVTLRGRRGLSNAIVEGDDPLSGVELIPVDIAGVIEKSQDVTAEHEELLATRGAGRGVTASSDGGQERPRSASSKAAR